MGISAIVLGLRNTFVKSQERIPPSSRLQLLTTPLAEDDINGLVKRVSQMVSIPTSTPFVTTINDIESAKSQNPAFYISAENGDRILSWTNMIVLYSTKRDIVLVAYPVTSIQRQDMVRP